MMMKSEWNALSDEAQLALGRAALCRAAEAIAEQAELLAAEIDHGAVADRGGANALRMLAAIVLGSVADPLPTMGNA